MRTQHLSTNLSDLIDLSLLKRPARSDKRWRIDAFDKYSKKDLWEGMQFFKEQYKKELKKNGIYKTRLQEATVAIRKRVAAEKSNTLAMKAKAGDYRRHANMFSKKLREAKKEIERLKALKSPKIKYRKYLDSHEEYMRRNPIAIKTTAWARILHRSRLLVSQTDKITIEELVPLIWMYKRDKVTSADFAREMNEREDYFMRYMARFRKRGWVASDKFYSRYHFHYLTPLGNDVATKVFRFITKNVSKRKKK